MANLLLKGFPIGSVDGVLFDKDGTLSHSEPHLLDLAKQRCRWRATSGSTWSRPEPTGSADCNAAPRLWP